MRIFIVIALGIAILGAAIFLTMFNDDVNEAPAPVSTMEQMQPTQPVKPEAVVENVRPSFDVVRINPDGDAVIAGRATPKAVVEVLDGENVLGTAKADNRGEWVFLPTSALEPGERELSLRATNPDGSVMTSENVVVLVVPLNKGEEVLALSMSKDGKGAVKALQTPGAEELVLSIDAVNYDETGKLSISGSAPEGANVLLYLDNDFLDQATADSKNQWSISPSKEVAPGIYKLRADQVDENKKVLNRVTIPFSRAEKLSNVPEDRKFVVQPGNSLWRIARRVYGTGFDYAVIYRANAEQITDPDLIYPGQVFEIPKQ